MTDPQSSSEEYEQDRVLHDPPPLQELKLFNPPSTHLSSRTFPNSVPCTERSSAHSSWSKPKSLNLDSASHIVNNVDSNSSRKKPASAELSCELGLGVWENPRRVCRICHRHFSSGRALGGHMRVHGPLFQPAGSKRKRNSLEFQESRKLEQDPPMDVSDSKQSDLSFLSKSLSEKEVLKFEDADETSESEGEAVEDAYTSGPYHAHSMYRGKDYDGVDEYYIGDNQNKRISIVADSTEDDHFTSMVSDTRHPLYKLRHKPKKSRRFAEEDFAMEMFLSGQGGNAPYPYSKGSDCSSLERHRVCSECGKSFGSWKALFGHMRCHPEREYRGILPPEDGSMPGDRARFTRKKLFTERRPLQDSDYELDSDVDNNKEFGTEVISYEGKNSVQMVEADQEVTEHDTNGSGIRETLKEGGLGTAREDEWNHRWPTGKRSRRKLVEGKAESGQHLNFSPHRDEPALTSESVSLEEPQEEHLQEETPNFLLMLAEAARKIEQDTQVGKNLLLHEPGYESKQYGEGHEGGKHGGEAALHALSARESQAATSSTNGLVKYECSTCKKSFNSHQALGGHRASHRKMKGCFARTNVGEDVGFGEYDLLREDLWQGHAHEKDPSLHVAEKDMKQQQIKGHECSICHRMFLTGQALGGHKRCHYIGERVAEAASFTSSNKQLGEEGLSSKLDTEGGSKLDLNMPAPADEDGTEVTRRVSAPLQLFVDQELDDKETKGASSEELSLASWPRKGLSGEERRSAPWELESRWAMGPAVAY